MVLLGVFSLGLSACPSVRESVQNSTSDHSSESCVDTATPFGGGDGSVSNPYLICSTAQIQNVSNALSSHFKLVKSLDLTGAVFSPIGSDDTTGFSGTFDGDHKTISGWIYHVASAGDDPYAIGLFRKIASGGTVKNLILNSFDLAGHSNNPVLGVLAGYSLGTVQDVIVQNSTISSYESAGGLIGAASGAATLSGSTVKNSQVSNPRPTCSNDASVGGVVGVWLSSGTISNVSADTVTVIFSPGSNSLSYSGGIVGRIQDGSLTESSSSGTITGYRSVGGIAGDSSAIISDSSTSMSVTGDSWVGGVVGVLSGTLARVSSSGDVFGSVPGSRIGGIVGTATGSSTISRVFHSGLVLGDDSVGGIVGFLTGGVMTNSYALGTVNGGSSSVGGAIGQLDDSGSFVSLLYVDESGVSANGGVTPQALVGALTNGASGPLNSYYVNRIPGIANSNGGVSIPVASCSVEASYFGFDFASVWKMPLVNPKGSNTPVLSWECGLSGVTCP